MPTNVRSNPSLLLTLTALGAFSLATAAQIPTSQTPTSQIPTSQTPAPAGSFMQPQPAPIERGATAPDTPRHYQAPPAVKTSQPTQGVYVRVSPQGSVTTVAATAVQTELRVDSGIANISIHHPAQNSLILVDFAGGQVDLMKDGMYTFNTDSKTVRVLVGEAQVFPNAAPGTDANARAIKVKEDHAVTFGGAGLRSVEFQLFDARGDVLPRDNAAGHGDARTAYPAYGFYGGYPYYAGGYPYAYDYPYYGYGYPYGFGYPYGLGLGFGFYGGGFYGGGFRGGGFRGRR